MNANNYIIGLLSVKYIERRDTFSRLNCIFPNFTNFPRNENQWIKRFPRIHQHVVRWIRTRGVKLEIVSCRRTSNRSWTMLHDFSFPFIRPSRCSRRASPRRRIGGEKKKKKSSRLGGNRKLPCYFSSNTVEGGRRVKRTRNRDAN